MAERRAALRLSRQQSTLGLDVHEAALVPQLAAAYPLPNTAEGPDGCTGEEDAFVDELDEDFTIDDGHFYDGVLEDA
jgi:hypothetical protein